MSILLHRVTLKEHRVTQTLKYILVFSLVILLSSAYGQDQGCWNIFRGNQRLSGSMSGNLPDQPKLLWSFSTGNMIKSSPVVCDDKIVIGSTSGIVWCLNTEGKPLWQFKTSNSIEAPALILDGKVYIGNLEGILYAIDLKSGSKVWEYTTENQIIGSVNWYRSGNTTYLLVGSYDYYLHCVDAKTGKSLWKLESDNYINGAAAINNGMAIFGGCDGFLHLVDIASGKEPKKINVATYVAASVAVEGNKAWVGDYDGRFSQVDLDKEAILWYWQDPKVKLPFLASPSLAGNFVINGSHDKNIYCFDKNSGKKIWNFNTGNRVEASPVVVGKRIIAANMRGDLFLLNLSDGKVVWKYELGSPVIGNAGVSGSRFYFGSSDGYVYCFGK
jgi:outer membrane protein assembly factor BamB